MTPMPGKHPTRLTGSHAEKDRDLDRALSIFSRGASQEGSTSSGLSGSGSADMEQSGLDAQKSSGGLVRARRQFTRLCPNVVMRGSILPRPSYSKEVPGIWIPPFFFWLPSPEYWYSPSWSLDPATGTQVY